MEILIFIVLGIISMLFKGKKPEEAPRTQKKQQTAQTGSSDPMRKLKEMSQEMYRELQREFQTEIDEPPSRQSSERTTAPVTTSLPSEVQKVERRDTASTSLPYEEKKQTRQSTRETNRGRLSAHQGNVAVKKSSGHNEMIPSTQQDLIKGIIFSEILGPPKSKQ